MENEPFEQEEINIEMNETPSEFAQSYETLKNVERFGSPSDVEAPEFDVEIQDPVSLGEQRKQNVATALSLALVDGGTSVEAKDFFAKNPQYDYLRSKSTMEHTGAQDYFAGELFVNEFFDGDAYRAASVLQDSSSDEERMSVQGAFNACKDETEAIQLIGKLQRERLVAARDKALAEEKARQEVILKNEAILKNVTNKIIKGDTNISDEEYKAIDDLQVSSDDFRRLSVAVNLAKKSKDLMAIDNFRAAEISNTLGNDPRLVSMFLEAVSEMQKQRSRGEIESDWWGTTSIRRTFEGVKDSVVKLAEGSAEYYSLLAGLAAPSLGNAELPIEMQIEAFAPISDDEEESTAFGDEASILEGKKKEAAANKLAVAMAQTAQTADRDAYNEGTPLGMGNIGKFLGSMVAEIKAYETLGKKAFFGAMMGENMLSMKDANPEASEEDVLGKSFAVAAGTTAAFGLTPVLMGKAGTSFGALSKTQAPAWMGRAGVGWNKVAANLVTKTSPAIERVMSNPLSGYAANIGVTAATLNVAMPIVQSTVQGIGEQALVKDPNLRTSYDDFKAALSFDNLTSRENIAALFLFGGLRTLQTTPQYREMRFSRSDFKSMGADDTMINEANAKAKEKPTAEDRIVDARTGEEREKTFIERRNDYIRDSLNKLKKENPEKVFKNVVENYRKKRKNQQVIYRQEDSVVKSLIAEQGYSWDDNLTPDGKVRFYRESRVDAEGNIVKGEKYMDISPENANEFINGKMLGKVELSKRLYGFDPYQKAGKAIAVKPFLKGYDEIRRLARGVDVEQMRKGAERVNKEIEERLAKVEEGQREAELQKLENEKVNIGGNEFTKRQVAVIGRDIALEAAGTGKAGAGTVSRAFVYHDVDRTTGQKRAILMLAEDADVTEVLEERLEGIYADWFKDTEPSDLYQDLNDLVGWLKTQKLSKEAKEILNLPKDVVERLENNTPTAKDNAMLSHAVREGLSLLGRANVYERIIKGDINAPESLSSFFRTYVQGVNEVMDALPIAEAINAARAAGKVSEAIERYLGEGAKRIAEDIAAEKERSAQEVVAERRKAEAKASAELFEAAGNTAKQNNPATKTKVAARTAELEKEDFDNKPKQDKKVIVEAEDSITGEREEYPADEEARAEVTSDGEHYVPDPQNTLPKVDKRFVDRFCTLLPDGGMKGLVSIGAIKVPKGRVAKQKLSGAYDYNGEPIVLLADKKGGFTLVSGAARLELAKANELGNIKAIVYERGSKDPITGEARDTKWAADYSLKRNIMDGTASIEDVAKYFRNHADMSEADARANGVVMRNGDNSLRQDFQMGFNIARNLSDAAYRQFAAGKITAEEADFVANMTPLFPANMVGDVQNKAIKAIKDARNENKAVNLDKVQEELTPKNIGEAKQMMLFDDGVFVSANAIVTEPSVTASIRVLHASPHAGIRKFSTKFMGTGEGSQVYGWGLYFTETGSKEINRAYFNFFSKRTSREKNKNSLNEINEKLTNEFGETILGQDVNLFGLSKEDLEYKIEDIEETISFVSSSKTFQSERYEKDVEKLKRYKDAINKIKNNSDYSYPSVYRVEINASNEELLPWNETLNESTKNKLRAKKELNDIDLDKSYGREIYEELKKVFGSDKKASVWLDSIGIKGILQTSLVSFDSANVGMNYIIFNENNVKITGYREGKPWDVSEEAFTPYTDPTAKFSLRKAGKRQEDSRVRAINRLNNLSSLLKDIADNNDNTPLGTKLATLMGDVLGFAKEYYRAFDAEGRRSIESDTKRAMMIAETLRRGASVGVENLTKEDFKQIIQSVEREIGYDVLDADKATLQGEELAARIKAEEALDKEAEGWSMKAKSWTTKGECKRVFSGLANAVAKTAENKLKTNAVSIFERELKRSAPSTKEAASYVYPNRYDAETTRKYKEIQKIYRMSEKDVDAKLDALASILHDEKITIKEKEDAQNEYNMYETFGAIKRKNPEQVLKAIENLRSIVETGETEWEKVISERRKQVGEYIKEAGITPETTLDQKLYDFVRVAEEGKHEQGIKKGLYILATIRDNLMSVGQMFSSFENLKGYARLGKDMAVKIANSNISYSRREEQALADMTNFLMSSEASNPYAIEGLGLKNVTEISNFFQKGKRIVKKSGVFKENGTIELRISPFQAMQLWLSLSQERYMKNSGKAKGYTEESLTQLEDFVERELGNGSMRFAKWMRSYIQNDGTKEVYEQRTGLTWDKNENYWRASFRRGENDVDYNEFGVDGVRFNPAFTKERVDHKLDFNESADAASIFFGLVAERNAYVAHGEMLDVMQSLLENEQYSVRMREALGEARYDVLVDDLRGISQLGMNVTKFNKALNAIINMAQNARAASILAGNVGTYVKQLTAFGHPLAIKGVNYFNLATEYAKILATKGYDAAATVYGARTPQEFLNEDVFKSRFLKGKWRNSRAAYRELVTASANATWSELGTLARVGMLGLEKTDLFANVIAARAVYNIKYREIKNDFKKKQQSITDEELHKQAMNYVELMLDQSAQPQNRFQKSAWVMKSVGDPLATTNAYMGGETMNKLGKAISLLHDDPVGALKYMAGMGSLEVGALMAIAMLNGASPITRDDMNWYDFIAANALLGITGAPVWGQTPFIGALLGHGIEGIGDAFNLKLLNVAGREVLVSNSLGFEPRTMKKITKGLTGEEAYTAAEWWILGSNLLRNAPALGGFFGGSRSIYQAVSSFTGAAQSASTFMNLGRNMASLGVAKLEEEVRKVGVVGNIEIAKDDIKKIKKTKSSSEKTLKLNEAEARLAYYEAVNAKDFSSITRLEDEMKQAKQVLTSYRKEKKEKNVSSGKKKLTKREELAEKKKKVKEEKKIYLFGKPKS